jgi:MocE subfamily Rieske [2Fe-2S] domain protein
LIDDKIEIDPKTNDCQFHDGDYSLTGSNAQKSVELGLAEADWYQTPLPRKTMRKFLQRSDGPAIRDTILWFSILLITAMATIGLWGTWWVVVPYLTYAVFYGTASDSRWHECSHGTPFQTDWMNNAVYEIASFMVMRESIIWRWSHNRHHSDTIIVGRDPEIQIPRPPDLWGLVSALVNWGNYKTYYINLWAHASGKMTEAEKAFVPESEFANVYRNARVVCAIYLVIVFTAINLQSWVPIFLFVLPQFFGTWLMIVHNTTQHAGLAENVLDHRLNCRTVYMNPISRFIYWNMNYHVEHHMYPLVPYYKLPELHEAIKADCPPPYESIAEAWREIFLTIVRQVTQPSYFIKRELPATQVTVPDETYRTDRQPDELGWLEICSVSDLDPEEVIRFDHGKKTFALIRNAQGNLFATDGICTHGNTHLGDGLVRGEQIECSKHNGRFNLKDGSAARAPICRGLATYQIEEREGSIWLNIAKTGGVGARTETTYKLKVVSNKNVATFIKELVLEPIDSQHKVRFTPGDYLQLNIPSNENINFSDFDIPEPYASVWQAQNLFDLKVQNTEQGRRNNYSLASNCDRDNQLRFNVRIATPPAGKSVPAGVGSSFVFNLKEGDQVSAIGSFGDFHIKPSQKEMVYIGGGAGMAPLKAHITQLFENDNTARKVSYWYGARSKQEIFYKEFFTELSDKHHNFSFHIGLSEPQLEDKWTGKTGFIHELVRADYLKEHAHIETIEFYLCGPPLMIKANTKMLKELGVKDQQIAFDEF